ncbi:hypothetical protein HAX54_023168, partial [Datura stramonium]|nr:hypothetical protein [Datura stramonium]
DILLSSSSKRKEEEETTIIIVSLLKDPLVLVDIRPNIKCNNRDMDRTPVILDQVLGDS